MLSEVTSMRPEGAPMGLERYGFDASLNHSIPGRFGQQHTVDSTLPNAPSPEVLESRQSLRYIPAQTMWAGSTRPEYLRSSPVRSMIKQRIQISSSPPPQLQLLATAQSPDCWLGKRPEIVSVIRDEQ